MYTPGTIKLTWVDAVDNSILYSQMYPDVKQALENTSGKKNWMLMKLSSTKDAQDEYAWEMLPYGSFSAYRALSVVHDNLPIKLALIAVALSGIYFLGTKLTQ